MFFWVLKAVTKNLVSFLVCTCPEGHCVRSTLNLDPGRGLSTWGAKLTLWNWIMKGCFSDSFEELKESLVCTDLDNPAAISSRFLSSASSTLAEIECKRFIKTNFKTCWMDYLEELEQNQACFWDQDGSLDTCSIDLWLQIIFTFNMSLSNWVSWHALQLTLPLRLLLLL